MFKIRFWQRKGSIRFLKRTFTAERMNLKHAFK